MKKLELYIVGIANQFFANFGFALAAAPSSQAAMELFCQYNYEIRTLVIHLHDKHPDRGWRRWFYKYDEDGLLVGDVEGFKLRVRAFFADRPEFAEIYLNYIFSEKGFHVNTQSTHPEDLGDLEFPIEMQHFILMEKEEIKRIINMQVFSFTAIPVLGSKGTFYPVLMPL